MNHELKYYLDANLAYINSNIENMTSIFNFTISIVFGVLVYIFRDPDVYFKSDKIGFASVAIFFPLIFFYSFATFLAWFRKYRYICYRFSYNRNFAPMLNRSDSMGTQRKWLTPASWTTFVDDNLHLEEKIDKNIIKSFSSIDAYFPTGIILFLIPLFSSWFAVFLIFESNNIDIGWFYFSLASVILFSAFWIYWGVRILRHARKVYAMQY